MQSRINLKKEMASITQILIDKNEELKQFAKELELKCTKTEANKIHKKLGTSGSLEQAVLKKLLVINA